MSNQLTWQFPPRNGGIEFIQDPSSGYFSDDPLPKLVREVVQNSLDAKQPGLAGPVEVVFAETSVSANLIGAAELKKHLTACRDRAKVDQWPNVQADYERALQALEPNQIRCLQIVDSGTTGLIGRTWESLVLQEGSVQKTGDSPGGSYGIGKNAVFNVSDLRTVFYSTRCFDRQEGGRVEKFQGKATLMAHSNPEEKSEHLQHIGFFAMPGGNPLRNREIPEFFRLGEVGAGVFVMGFNPRSAEWEKEITAAVIENFFYAIHHKNLIVRIEAQGADSIVVNHESLDWLFEGQGNNRPAYHYYKAIRDAKAVTTDNIGKIGPLDVYLSIGSGPRRTAYINRNGMLITDSREQKTNPMAPRGSSLWPDFAALVAPATDKGDQWIRKTENASHDAMSPRRLFGDRERRDAERRFKEARDAIRKIIDDAAQVEKYGDTSNLNELAQMFPDEFDPSALGNRQLQTRVSGTRVVPTIPAPLDTVPGPVPEPRPEPEPNPDPAPRPEPNPDPEPKPRPEPRPAPNPRSARPPRLERPRFIPTGPAAATVAFAITEDPPRQVKLALTPVGAEWSGQEDRIDITDATVISPKDQEVSLADGVVLLTPVPNERVVIKIATSGTLGDLAFRIG